MSDQDQSPKNQPPKNQFQENLPQDTSNGDAPEGRVLHPLSHQSQPSKPIGHTWIESHVERNAVSGGLLGILARHRTAANLLMVLLILAGIWAVSRLQTQLFPDATRDAITVSASWPGATADDIDKGIVDLLEPALRFLENLDSISSSSSTGSARISLAYEPGTDMQKALADVESALSQIAGYPEGAEDPEARQNIRYDTVFRIVLSGPFTEAALQEWAVSLRDELLSSGIDRVDSRGMRDQQIIAEISEYQLRRLGLSLDAIASQIRATSSDIPAGEIGGGRALVRSLGRIGDDRDFANLAIVSGANGAELALGDIAHITTRFDPDQAQLFRNGNPAIELQVERALSADSLETAAKASRVLAKWQATAPATLAVERYNYSANYLKQRIGLLIKNGFGGMVLVLLALFVFMNTRSAIWVAAGIPTSLLITMGIMLVMGVTINMISVFAMLLTLGIIVDDAIVVSEHSETLYKRGASAEDAAVGGAIRMVFPVLSSSLTTVAAFAPLMLIGGFMGRFVSDIPVVVSIVIFASLLECFLILPGHMRHSFHALSKDAKEPTALRRWIDAGFDGFKNRLFRPLVASAIKIRYGVIAIAALSLFWAITMISTGTLPFKFMDFPESERISQEVRMVAGTPRAQTEIMAREMERAFWVAVEQQLQESPSPQDIVDERGQAGKHPLIEMAIVNVSSATSARMDIELVPGDQRAVRNQDLVRAWSDGIKRLGAVDSLVTRQFRFGGSATDIAYEITGPDIDQLKILSGQVQGFMAAIPGLAEVQDSLPFGTPEKIIRLTPQGRALGLSVEQVGRQLRNAINGIQVESLQNGDRETTVRLQLPQAELERLALEQILISTPNGGALRLGDVASIEDKQGLAQILREDGRRVITITADMTDDKGDVNAMIATLKQRGLEDLVQAAGLEGRFVGEAEEQRQAFGDLTIAVMISAAAIYIILAWVFASYLQPIIVILTIPFGLIGAVWGLWMLGYPLSFLAIISFVGLSGIVVNDSIILVSTINELKQRMALFDAIVEGSCERLRAVLLTSSTTIGGLTPLMFETSRQAQFLIPMAVVMVFGLLVATVLVLFLVPALMAVLADIRLVKRAQPSANGIEQIA